MVMTNYVVNFAVTTENTENDYTERVQATDVAEAIHRAVLQYFVLDWEGDSGSFWGEIDYAETDDNPRIDEDDGLPDELWRIGTTFWRGDAAVRVELAQIDYTVECPNCHGEGRIIIAPEAAALDGTEIDCGWRWKPFPRFRVTVKAELGGWVVYEVYADADAREVRLDFFTDRDSAVAFGWAHRKDEA